MMEYTYENFSIIAGCDEAGRGCLAGPVFAAAVILPQDINIEGLNDSKQLSHKKRMLLRDIIIEKSLCYAVESVDNQTIDEINILNASFLAMHKAIDALKITPEILLIDGNRFNKYKNISHRCIVKGDAKFAQIAAASILAKTYRDEYMETIHEDYPVYAWKENKGYPTKKHADAILQHGFSPYHRKTFSVPSQIKLF